MPRSQAAIASSLTPRVALQVFPFLGAQEAQPADPNIARAVSNYSLGHFSMSRLGLPRFTNRALSVQECRKLCLASPVSSITYKPTVSQILLIVAEGGRCFSCSPAVRCLLLDGLPRTKISSSYSYSSPPLNHRGCHKSLTIRKLCTLSRSTGAHTQPFSSVLLTFLTSILTDAPSGSPSPARECRTEARLAYHCPFAVF